ncbi:MAG: hypothetical protein AAFR60_06905 [Pseudomonadota bacterium]
MRDYGRARAAFSLTVGAILVGLSYEFGNAVFVRAAIPTFGVAIVAFFVGSRLAAWLFDVLLMFGPVRRLFGGRSFVEGHWHVRGRSTEKSEHPLDRSGVIAIQHDAATNEARVITSRLGREGELFTSMSEIAYVQADARDTRYLNYFKMSYPGPETTFGMSSGVFSNPDQGAGPPSVLETHTAVAGGGPMIRQQATRIDGRTRRRWRRQFGNFWIEKYLAADGDFAAAMPDPIREPLQELDEDRLKAIGSSHDEIASAEMPSRRPNRSDDTPQRDRDDRRSDARDRATADQNALAELRRKGNRPNR